MTVDKTHFVNLNLSKMVSVKFCKFEIKLKFIGYVFLQLFSTLQNWSHFPDVKRTSNHCEAVLCGLHLRVSNLEAF
jgi:hypothetical protein